MSDVSAYTLAMINVVLGSLRSYCSRLLVGKYIRTVSSFGVRCGVGIGSVGFGEVRCTSLSSKDLVSDMGFFRVSRGDRHDAPRQ